MTNLLKQLKNNQGYALLYTFLVLILVSVLGLSLVTTSSNTLKTSANEREDQSIYYIAEAGLNVQKYLIKDIVKDAYETTKNSITKNSTEAQLVSDYLNLIRLNVPLSEKKYSTFQKQNNVAPESSIFILENTTDPLTYKIISNGYFITNPSKKRVLSQIIDIPKPTFLTPNVGDGLAYSAENAILTRGDMLIKATINGDLSLISGKLTIDWGANITGDLHVNPSNITKPNSMDISKNKITSNINFPGYDSIVPPFPDDIFSNKATYFNLPNISLFGNNNGTLNLEDNSYIKQIKIDNNTNLTINVGNTDKNLIIDDLNVIQGSIKIIGAGKLNIYVTNNLKVKGFYNQNGDSNLSNIYYAGSSSLTFTGETHLNASLFAKTSITFENIGGGIKGNIVTTGPEVTFKGGASANGQYIIAPNAHVLIDNGAHIKGSIVANSVTVQGGSSVTFGKSIISTPKPIIPENPTTLTIESPMIES